MIGTGVFIAFAGTEGEGQNNLHGFHQDENFYYLTGSREPGAARTQSHGKIVLRVASHEHDIRTRAHELYLARGAQPGRALEDWLQAERELTVKPRRTN